MEEKIEVEKRAPRKNSAKSRTKGVYACELRLKAVKLHLEEGISREVIRRELGVGGSSVSNWVAAYRREGVRGRTNREIVAVRNTSFFTVKNQISHLPKKLQIRSRVALAALFRDIVLSN